MREAEREVLRSLIMIFLVVSLGYVARYTADLVLRNYFRSSIEYLTYINDLLTAIVIGISGYFVVRIVLGEIDRYVFSGPRSRLHGLRLIVEIFLYTVVVLAILFSLGVNITGAVVGGTVGGIIVGLAVQTVTSNVLSGLLATWSGAVEPGEVLSLVSPIWGSPIIAKVKRVRVLFTEVETVNGNSVKLPNSAFLGNTVFTSLSDSKSLLYTTQVSVSYDVEAERLVRVVKSKLEESLRANGVSFNVYFTSRAGTVNTFTVTLRFSDFERLNEILDQVNMAFDKAYWELKKGIPA